MGIEQIRNPAESVASASQEIIVVDLDRTLLATDTTIESMLTLLARNPLDLAWLLASLPEGRSKIKAELAVRARPNISCMPLNQEVVQYLEAARAGGAKLILASASNEALVNAVAQRLELFDEVYGSTRTHNLKGRAKAEFLNEKFGAGQYTYLGDSEADLSVWQSSKRAITVGAPKALRRKVEATCETVEHLDVASRPPTGWTRAALKAMRPHQWSKNALLFVSPLAAQAFSTPEISAAILGFIVFSLVASSVYILNDLLDLEDDRQHPRKRNRPFASGALPVKDGLWLSPTLFLVALGIAIAFLPLFFMLILFTYCAASLSYSLGLKKKALVDTFLLAGLYTIRVLAGGAATGIPMSPWLVGFALFFFLALAFVKRMSEVVDLAENPRAGKSKRDYSEIDLGTIQSFGAASGYGAILILILYFTSPEATELYLTPEILWGVAPLMLYWISRMLLLAKRGEVDDDPIIFAARDKTSIAVGVCVLAIVALADRIPL